MPAHVEKSILAFVLFVFFHSTVLSQRPPIKFGKISLEEFEQSICPIDSSASAMVTCNYGHLRGHDFSYMQVLRVKIIKKEGTNYGSIVTYGGETARIRGFTYNLENGKIEKTKLHRKSVFKERVTDNYYRYRIAMPNVKEG